MGNTSRKFGLKRLEELPPRNSSSDRIGFEEKTFPRVSTARVANAWNGWKHLSQGLPKDYSSAFAVYMVVFVSPSILLFQGKSY